MEQATREYCAVINTSLHYRLDQISSLLSWFW